ncbi:hypothetical protein I204_05504 [Kwoniella mangroviensis CBS 8886]|nr:hypothetical protein I204_05504 [Kwoniella mangroviensis CBS 8886]
MSKAKLTAEPKPNHTESPSPFHSLSPGVDSLPLSSGIDSLPETLPSDSPPNASQEFATFAESLSISKTSGRAQNRVESGDVELSTELALAHQVCAFEQLFHEALAAFHGTKQPAMRSSLREKIDRSSVKGVKRELKGVKGTEKEDDIHYLIGLLEKITDSQRNAKDNIINERLLTLIQDNFINALLNRQVELRTCRNLSDNQVGLFRRNTSTVERTTKKRSRSGKDRSESGFGKMDMTGIEYIILTLPTSKIRDIDDAEKHRFHPGLCFERLRDGKVTVMMNLGFGRSVNHACICNVDWEMPDDELYKLIDAADGGVATQEFEFVQTSSIRPGEELLAYYSEFFAKNFCTCRWGDKEDHNYSSSSSEHDSSPDYTDKKSNKKKRYTKKKSAPLSNMKTEPSDLTERPLKRNSKENMPMPEDADRTVHEDGSTLKASAENDYLENDRGEALPCTPEVNAYPNEDSYPTFLPYQPKNLQSSHALQTGLPEGEPKDTAHFHTSPQHLSDSPTSLTWGFTDADPEERIIGLSAATSNLAGDIQDKRYDELDRATMDLNSFPWTPVSTSRSKTPNPVTAYQNTMIPAPLAQKATKSGRSGGSRKDRARGI